MAPNDEKEHTISKAMSHAQIGEFWDTHDLADHWDETTPIEVDVKLDGTVTLYALDGELSDRLREVAHRRGISPETLLNLWVQERLSERVAPQP